MTDDTEDDQKLVIELQEPVFEALATYFDEAFGQNAAYCNLQSAATDDETVLMVIAHRVPAEHTDVIYDFMQKVADLLAQEMGKEPRVLVDKRGKIRKFH